MIFNDAIISGKIVFTATNSLDILVRTEFLSALKP